MTDSINKFEKEFPDHILNVSVNHIKKNYEKLSVDWKSWGVFVVWKTFLNGNLVNENDTINIIDEFYKYHQKHYQEYCNNIALCSDEFIKDLGFVKKYLKKKSVD